MKKIFMLTAFAAFFLNSNYVQAQQFQWVTGGGTNQDLTSAPGVVYNEGTYFMCTDPNGNVYTLSEVGDNSIYADTFYRAEAYGANNNILLTSYTCSGQMRWAKLIASSAYYCFSYGIVADSLGHIYVAGYIPNGTLHIGYDTSISGLVNDVIGLIQLDTNGHFNWIQDVGNNTITSYDAATIFASLTIDNANNVHFVPYLKSGSVLMPGITSHCGNYDLKYNSSGTLLSAKRLQLDSSILVSGVVIDKQSNTRYAYGYRNPSFTDSSLYNFIAAFDTTDNQIWIDTIGDPLEPATGLIQSIIADGNGHLYISGSGDGYLIYRGDTIAPSIGAYGGYVAYIMKLDTAGNRNWVSQCNGSSVAGLGSIALLNGNKVAATGAFYVSIESGTVSLTNPTAGSEPILYITDTSGNPLTLQGIHGDGYYNTGNVIVSDKTGNLYIGGTVADSIAVDCCNGITPYVSVGGNTDFFVLKYGVLCSCSSITTVVPTFTSVGSSTVSFTYTGSTTSLDSVVWDYGDGTTGSGTAPVHIYTLSGTYTVCVTEFTQCGNTTNCSDIVVNTSLAVPIASINTIQVYPNPVSDELNITGIVENRSYRILSVTGSTVQQGQLQQSSDILSMKNLSPGVYILEITGINGERNIVRVIKE